MKRRPPTAADHLPWPWLAALLVAGLAVRLAGLGARDLWLDEWVSLHVASQPAADVAAGRVADFDNHTPPLYYLLLHLWLAMVPPGVATLRLPAVLLDLGVLALLAVAAGRWFGRRVALAAGAAYALSPFAVRLAQEGRMYTLLVLLVLLAAVLAVELERWPRRRWPAAALALVAAAALYTHYHAAFSLVALHGSMAWRLRRRPRLARRWWAAAGAAALLFLPWLPVVAGLVLSGGQFFRGPGWLELPHALLRFTVGYALAPVTLEAKADPWSAALGHLPLLAAVGAAAGGGLLLGARRALRMAAEAGPPRSLPAAEPTVERASAAPAATVVLALAVVPPLLALAVSLVVPSLDERYLAASFPFFVLLLAIGLAEGSGGWVRRALAALLAVLWLAGAAAHVAEPAAGGTPWRQAAAELRRIAGAEARVAVEPGWYAPLVEYHLAGDLEVVRARSLRPAPLGDSSRETWLLEVLPLSDGGAWLRQRGWRVVPHRLLAGGKTLRLGRLEPAEAPAVPGSRLRRSGSGG